MYDQTFADLRMRVALFLERPVPESENPVVTLNEVMDKAELIEAEIAEARRKVAETRQIIRDFDTPKGCL